MTAAVRLARTNPLPTPAAISSVIVAPTTNLSRPRLRRPRILWSSLALTLAETVEPPGLSFRDIRALEPPHPPGRCAARRPPHMVGRSGEAKAPSPVHTPAGPALRGPAWWWVRRGGPRAH